MGSKLFCCCPNLSESFGAIRMFFWLTLILTSRIFSYNILYNYQKWCSCSIYEVCFIKFHDISSNLSQNLTRCDLSSICHRSEYLACNFKIKKSCFSHRQMIGTIFDSLAIILKIKVKFEFENWFDFRVKSTLFMKQREGIKAPVVIYLSLQLNVLFWVKLILRSCDMPTCGLLPTKDMSLYIVVVWDELKRSRNFL